MVNNIETMMLFMRNTVTMTIMSWMMTISLEMSTMMTMWLKMMWSEEASAIVDSYPQLVQQDHCAGEHNDEDDDDDDEEDDGKFVQQPATSF